jgi:hypothetical protein
MNWKGYGRKERFPGEGLRKFTKNLSVLPVCGQMFEPGPLEKNV